MSEMGSLGRDWHTWLVICWNTGAYPSSKCYVLWIHRKIKGICGLHPKTQEIHMQACTQTDIYTYIQAYQVFTRTLGGIGVWMWLPPGYPLSPLQAEYRSSLLEVGSARQLSHPNPLPGSQGSRSPILKFISKAECHSRQDSPTLQPTELFVRRSVSHVTQEWHLFSFISGHKQGSWEHLSLQASHWLWEALVSRTAWHLLEAWNSQKTQDIEMLLLVSFPNHKMYLKSACYQSGLKANWSNRPTEKSARIDNIF